MAAMDPRVSAVCINGAPMAPTVPDFRTAREQMVALFGVESEAALEQRLTDLRMSPHKHRIDAAMLVVEGGRDPLVALGDQASVFDLGQRQRCQLMTLAGWRTHHLQPRGVAQRAGCGLVLCTTSSRFLIPKPQLTITNRRQP
jgi:hypothetical protein